MLLVIKCFETEKMVHQNMTKILRIRTSNFLNLHTKE